MWPQQTRYPNGARPTLVSVPRYQIYSHVRNPANSLSAKNTSFIDGECPHLDRRTIAAFQCRELYNAFPAYLEVSRRH